MNKLAFLALLTVALSNVSATASAADKMQYRIPLHPSSSEAPAGDGEGFLSVPAGLEWGYEFPATPLNTTAPVYTFSLTNTGTGPVDVTGIDIALGRENFNQTNTCGKTLGVGAKCNISVSFTPTELGTQWGWVTVMNSANSFSIQMMGAGLGVAFVFNGYPPASQSFANTIVGSSTTKTFSIYNLGNITGSVELRPLAGANPGDFRVDNGCINVEQNGSCDVKVTFSPTAFGTRSATLNLLGTAFTLTGAGQ
jgi:hypothetical protein